MILVTVGMHTQPFDRLIKKMDEIAAMIDEEVIMQIGHATYIPRHARYFRFTTGEEMLWLYTAASVVITHGGTSAAEILRTATPLIAMPRLPSHGEVIDDHQLDFVRTMERKGLLTAVYDVDELERALRHTPMKAPRIQQDNNLVAALRRYLKAFEEGCRD